MTKDKGQTFEISVSPDSSGTYKVGVELIAWRYDATYVDSSFIELTFDDDLIQSPVSPEFKRNQMLLVVGEIVAVVALLGLGFVGFKFLSKKFSKWKLRENQKNQT
jgi:hypothetical protein